jgi:hypothetical protein
MAIGISKIIRHEGSEWVLYASDGKRVLGRHKTKQEAERQEAAIYASRARRVTRKALEIAAAAAMALAKRYKDCLLKKSKE